MGSVKIREQVDARKVRLGRKDLKGLLEGVKKLTVAKGRKVEVRDPRDGVADAAALMLGPTGNLRAPTLRKGTHLVVGFHADVYQDLLG